MIERIKQDWAKARSCIGYIKRRLGERSTWLAISGGVAAAATLPMPWSAVCVGIAVIMALLPEKPAA